MPTLPVIRFSSSDKSRSSSNLAIGAKILHTSQAGCQCISNKCNTFMQGQFGKSLAAPSLEYFKKRRYHQRIAANERLKLGPESGISGLGGEGVRR